MHAVEIHQFVIDERQIIDEIVVVVLRTGDDLAHRLFEILLRGQIDFNLGFQEIHDSKAFVDDGIGHVLSTCEQ